MAAASAVWYTVIPSFVERNVVFRISGRCQPGRGRGRGGMLAVNRAAPLPLRSSKKIETEFDTYSHRSKVVLKAAPGSGGRIRIMSLAGEDEDEDEDEDEGDLEAKPAKRAQTFEDFLPDLDELDKDELQDYLELELETDLDTGTLKHYEIMFLIHEKHADEVQSVIEKIQDFIAVNKGVIHRLNNWGMRQLAYRIKKASKANYILMNIEISSQVVNDLNTLFEKDERVIRHMVMSQKVGITDDSEPPEEYPSSMDVEEDEDYEEEEDDEESEEINEEEVELVLQRE